MRLTDSDDAPGEAIDEKDAKDAYPVISFNFDVFGFER